MAVTSPEAVVRHTALNQMARAPDVCGWADRTWEDRCATSLELFHCRRRWPHVSRPDNWRSCSS